MRQLFSRAGFSTVEAANGRQAVVTARDERPALVLLEVSLPDISGFEICHELRDHFGEDLPIIFVSGERIQPIDRAVGLFMGADDYVVKPFHPDELLARARRAIVRTERVQERFAVTPGSELSKRKLEGSRTARSGSVGV